MNLTEKSAYIKSRLEGAKGVVSVSGLGLMIGIKTVKPAGEVLAACMEKGVLCLTAKDKVRLLPPLNIFNLKTPRKFRPKNTTINPVTILTAI